MTLAISKALEEGAKAGRVRVDRQHVGLRRGLRARAGMTCGVLIPEGYIALGKLAQALVHGAKVSRSRELRRGARHRARLGGGPPSPSSTR